MKRFIKKKLNEELQHWSVSNADEDLHKIENEKENTLPEKGNYGYHVGDLKHKTEFIGDKAFNGRYLAISGIGKPSRTGHFGAGFFFFGSREKAEEYKEVLKSNFEIKVVDFSQYNLYKPSNPKEFVEGTISLTNQLILVPKDYEKTSEFKDLISQLKEDLDYFGVNLPINKIYSITKEFIIDITTYSNPKSDYIITRFLKAAGYEGLDLRGTKYDSFYIGSVLYDIKPSSVLT